MIRSSSFEKNNFGPNFFLRQISLEYIFYKFMENLNFPENQFEFWIFFRQIFTHVLYISNLDKSTYLEVRHEPNISFSRFRVYFFFSIFFIYKYIAVKWF